MGMSEKFDDIIAGLVSKIAGLVSKAERASASLREYSDHALALRFDREVAFVEFGDWYYFRLMAGDWERAPDFYGRRGIEIDWARRRKYLGPKSGRNTLPHPRRRSIPPR